MTRSTPLVIGIDVGGTKVLAVETDGVGRVVRSARRETPGRLVDAVLVEDALTGALQEVADGRPVAAVGLAAAGFVDRLGERVRFAPHLPWRDDPRAGPAGVQVGDGGRPGQRRQLRGAAPRRRTAPRVGTARRW